MSIAIVKLRSRALFMNTDFAVVLPDPGFGQTYEKGKKYKVLWLLHGAGNDYTEWLYGAHLTTHLRGHDTIVVLPSAQNSDYGCYPDFGTGYDFPKFFFEELMPYIYANFPASPKPEDNFIAGASMGGYGSMMLGLMHPDKFGGIAAYGSSMRESEFLEPYTGMTGAEFRTYAMAHRTEFRTEYGNRAEGIKPKEINVIAKYPTVQAFLDSDECMFRRFPEKMKEYKLPPMYITVGTEDLFYEPTLRFKAYADSLGADNITYWFAEGYGHGGGLWELSLKETIKMFDL